jgi:hypothetical protein
MMDSALPDHIVGSTPLEGTFLLDGTFLDIAAAAGPAEVCLFVWPWLILDDDAGGLGGLA